VSPARAGARRAALSPWERALGDDVLLLDPALRRYVGRLAPGVVGVGRGRFEEVGCANPAVRPLFALAGALRMAWPGHTRDVAFTVRNVQDGPRLRAELVLHTAAGDRVMVDRVVAVKSRGRRVAVDRVGRGGLLELRFLARAVEGGMRLESCGASLRLGPVRIPIPRGLAPRVTLDERAAGESQRVDFSIEMPGFGRVYGYRGEFRYLTETR